VFCNYQNPQRQSSSDILRYLSSTDDMVTLNEHLLILQCI